MNIPMAYDVVPSDQQHHNNGVIVNQQRGFIGGNGNTMSHMANGAGAGGDGLSQPLLLSEEEQQWAAEMAQEGIAHLPISWYRQTPKKAVWGAYGIINRAISSLVNFGINVGLGYAILSSNDEIGLWQEPDHGDHPYKSAAFSDLIITTFLIAFLSTLLSTPGIRKAMKDGQTVPVDQDALRGGCYKCLPISMLGTCSRSLTLSIWAIIVVCFPMIILLTVVCSAGGMHDSGAQCSMEKHTYIFVKATYSFVVAWIIYPIILLMTLNTATLPPLDLTFFVQNQKARWEKQQREKQPEPL